MNFDYSKICQNLLRDLPERQKEAILRRFGLKTGQKETLESIGQDLGITRERVRQIQEDGFSRLRPKLNQCQNIFQYLADQLKTTGNLRREEILLSQLGGEKYQSQIFFLLTLGEPFKRFSETEKLHSLWTINPDSLALAKKAIDSFYGKLKEIGTLLPLKKLSKEINSFSDTKEEILSSYLEISKIIQKNQEGLLGLKDWPEINPRGIKDKAYLVFKKTKTPLHFMEVAKRISPDALPQTVHNELIRDPRFVLVGRGLYALKEWGYEEGQVKDIISKVLKESGKPLSKEEVLGKVLKQRLVKENTISLNLANKKYFLRTPEGKYLTKES